MATAATSFLSPLVTPKYHSLSCQSSFMPCHASTALSCLHSITKNTTLSFSCTKKMRKRGTNVVRAATLVTSDRSFLLSCTLLAQEEHDSKVTKLCQSITNWSLDKLKDRDSGMLQFECFPDLYKKSTYHFMERYSSFDSIVNTHALPEHKKFMEDVRPLLVQPMAFAVYEYRDGKVGHMMHPYGPKGEGGLDDATGQAGVGGGISHKQTSKFARDVIVDGTEKEEKDDWTLQKSLEKLRFGKKKQAEKNAESTKS